MAYLTIPHLSEQIQYYVRATSWAAKCMGVCLVLLTALVPLLWGKYQEFLQLQTQLSDQTPARPSLATQNLNRPDLQLLAFYAHIPKEATCNQLISRFLGIANAHAIEYNDITYRLMPIANPKLSRLDIVMPLKGKYLDIRQFIVDTLNAFPSAAIANMQFERVSADETLVNAKLHFNVYFLHE